MSSFGIQFPGILSQWHSTKNNGLNPADFGPSSKQKVWWSCDKVSTDSCNTSCKHEWIASIKNRCGLNRGCPTCAGKKICVHTSIAITHKEIASQWHPTKNGTLTTSMVSRGSRQKAVWLCQNICCSLKCPHEWSSKVSNRCISERGCPFCSDPPKRICKHNSIVCLKPELASQWHPTDNKDLNPEEYSLGSNESILWQCPINQQHKWPAPICSRIRSDGTITSCSICLNQRADQTNCLLTTHPDLAAQWHPTKNGDLKPTMVTAGHAGKVWWFCSKLSTADCTTEECKHEWDATVTNRTIHNVGCPICSAKGATRDLCKHRYIDHTHPEIASQFHPNKNGDLRVNKILSGSPKPVWWICHKLSTSECTDSCRHEWKTSPANRIGIERKCPFCSDPPKQICVHKSITTTHPHIAKQWHPTKNGVLRSDDYSFGSDTKVWWACTKDLTHEWETAIKNRCCRGSDCIHCFRKSEAKLLAYLRKYYPSVQTQFRLESCRQLRFDFYIPELNIIIELDGEQHFRQVSNWHPPVQTAKRDVFKMLKAEEKGIKVIRISQQDVWKKDDDWLDRELLCELINPDRTMICISTDSTLYDYHITLFEDASSISECDIQDY